MRQEGFFSGIPDADKQTFRKIQRLNIEKLQRLNQEVGAMGNQHRIVHGIRMTEDDYRDYYNELSPGFETDAIRSLEDWLYSMFVSGDITTIREASILLHGGMVISKRTGQPKFTKDVLSSSGISTDEVILPGQAKPTSQRKHLLQHVVAKVVLYRREHPVKKQE